MNSLSAVKVKDLAPACLFLPSASQLMCHVQGMCPAGGLAAASSGVTDGSLGLSQFMGFLSIL